ncbi:hypothetical protein HII28_00025 [Planctomonas sp. JC2975]|uniref:hypothetical protein n=1 Tax=Planctomonas sp. JC2975 TaxID=2729626 RepID=UPI001475EBE1|nr:hypothetical protein [Planctomonas sp. JC2975]NNC10274.1 hypothetical protein [Planctomonas sp. JC2975]
MSGVGDGVDDDGELARKANDLSREAGASTSEDGAAGAISDPTTDSDVADGGLVSRLQLIEERPLQDRADAYGRIHGELVDALEGADHPELDD